MKILVLRVINSSRHRKGLVRGYIHSLFVSKAFTRLSGTGIRQISHRFMFQIGLLLLSIITDFFGCLLLFFFFPPTKTDLTTLFRNQKVQCSMEIVFHLVLIMVMLSCHVMSCYVTLPTLLSPYLTLRLQWQI